MLESPSMIDFEPAIKQAPAAEANLDRLLTSDGCEHFIRHWPAQNQQACLLYLHGIEGHSLWFDGTASFLQERGISTMALDRRGSGLSKEKRGHIESYKHLLSDTDDFIDFAKSKLGNCPLFLMANCWGAKLAVLTCQKTRNKEQLAGMILSSPAIEVKVDFSLGKKLLIAWRFLTGNKEELEIPIKLEDFTDNPQYLNFIGSDSMRLTKASAAFFVNTFILTLKSKSCPRKIVLPTLILQSGKDNIVDEKGLAGWFKRLKSQDKTMRVFEGVHHSLDFHKDPDEYRLTLANWIIEKSKKSERSELNRENSLA